MHFFTFWHCVHYFCLLLDGSCVVSPFVILLFLLTAGIILVHVECVLCGLLLETVMACMGRLCEGLSGGWGCLLLEGFQYGFKDWVVVDTQRGCHTLKFN